MAPWSAGCATTTIGGKPSKFVWRSTTRRRTTLTGRSSSVQLAESREICERGEGGWFGAFADGQLVSTLGLIRAVPDVGRYQTVETLDAYRRQGLAGRLLFEASRWGASTLGLRRLVICADPEYHALRLYQALGFEVVERQVQLQRPPAPE